MGMFLGSIKNIAGDYAKKHRWAKVNLTDDDSNDSRPEKLSQRRIVGITKTKVRLMGNDGSVVEVEPNRIQSCW